MNIQKLYVSATEMTDYVEERIREAIDKAGLSVEKGDTIPGSLYRKYWDWLVVPISGETEKFMALLQELFSIDSEVIVSKVAPFGGEKMDEDTLWVELYNDHRE